MGPAVNTQSWTYEQKSPIRGALLGLLVARMEMEPTHGYQIAKLLARRLGPAWQIEPKGIYTLLEKLVDKGLVDVEIVTGGAGVGPDQKRYRANEHASAALSAWMRARVTVVPRRGEMEAKISAAREQDIPVLGLALDDYQRDCFQLMRESEDLGPAPMVSWGAVTMNITREAADLHLRAELMWIERARSWIADWRQRGPQQPPRQHR